MSVFLSTYINKIDKKGRISVPSAFRVVLSAESYNGIIAYPSFINPCVEASGMNRIEKLFSAIDSMDPYSEERDAFATSILGGSEQLQMDAEGRITLTEKLISISNLKDAAAFVGKGHTFEIWNPETFEKYSAKAKEIALKSRGSLSLSNKG